jgi:hypothetical protein
VLKKCTHLQRQRCHQADPSRSQGNQCENKM